MKYRDMKVHESYKHKLAKEVLCSWLNSKQGLPLIINGEKIIIKRTEDYGNWDGEVKHGKWWTEVPATRQMFDKTGHISGHAYENMPTLGYTCFDRCTKGEHKHIRHEYSNGSCFTTIVYSKEFYKNLNDHRAIIESSKDNTFYCNNCPFNEFDYDYIFDIGWVSPDRQKRFKYCIEIKNTNPVNERKIQLCKDEDINLFEIDADTILRHTEKPNEILVSVHNRYTDGHSWRYEHNV